MYIIKSPRIGLVGTEYKPQPTDKLAALIELGFIEQTDDEVSTTAPKKSAKNKKATLEE